MYILLPHDCCHYIMSLLLSLFLLLAFLFDHVPPTLTLLMTEPCI